MKLYYCPSYSGFVYTDLNKLMFNEKIADTAALIEELKLHAGMYSEKKESIERTVNYYKAMKAYMAENPSNILKKSFDVDGLSAAKVCLQWRDTLTFAGWNMNTKAPSKRMEALCGIEAYFSDKSTGEELISVTEAVKNGCSLPENLEIETPFDYKFFSPLEVDLLEALKSRNVSVTVREFKQKKDNVLKEILSLLDSKNSGKNQAKIVKKDDSFNILHFEEENDSCKYLSLLKPDEYKVWINSDNKVLDNWLTLEGKPVSGSRINGGMPQITQILPVGLGILSTPMNLKNMVDWLNLPVSPLDSALRKNLEKKIAREGGYFNNACRKVLEDFIFCKYEFENIPEAEKTKKIEEESKRRKNQIEKFLPDINEIDNSNDGTVNLNKAKLFVSNLYSWCGKKIALVPDEMEKAQLGMVKNECAAVLSMLEAESADKIDFTKLMSFVTGLKDGVDMLQYEAEAGCRNVINKAGQLASPVESLIWCDFYNEEKENLKYDFLLPEEKAEFSKSLKLWNEETERNYNRKIDLLPFYLSEKITIVTVDKKVTEDVEKHPFYIQLEKKIENLADFISNPDINKEFKNLTTAAKVINNGMLSEEEGLSLKKADLIQWPDKETYSSFEQLVYNPFDYAFSYLAGISSLGNSSLPEVNAAHGTVAHAVIETLFNKNEDIKNSGTVPYIKEKIKNDFDSVFTDTVNGCGAILLLKENILNLDNFKVQVFKCVNSLVKVLEDNKLHVLACEPWLENTEMNFYKNIKIGGYADMILADEKDNPVVFDFKWSPGKQEKYKKTIEENKSIQLELYKHLTKQLAGKEASSVAYVILPEVIVVSASDFISEKAIKVQFDNPEEQLLPKLMNSYKYRRGQISSGFVEEATGFSPDLITYQKDSEDKNLIPLNFDGTRSPKKQAKSYPQYELFKSKK